MKKQFHALIFLFAFPSLTGCLSIDFSVIQDRSFYKKTTDVFKQIESENPSGVEPKPFLAGTAKTQIISPDGIHLAGYGKRRSKKSVSVHDPVFIRALAVEAGSKRVVIVNCDLLAVSNELFETVLEKVNHDIHLKPEDLMITATHTHSGPGGLSDKFWEGFATGPFHEEFFETLTDQMAGVIVQAIGDLEPARIQAERADASDLIKNRMVEDGPIDPEVGIIEFQIADGKEKAILVNFSAHATVLGSENLSMSGDYPGAMEQHLEQEQGTIALFTAGAVGDQTARPPEVKNGNPEKIRMKRAAAMGKILAERVQQAIEHDTWIDCGGIDSIRIPVYLPPTQVRVSKNFRLPSFFGNLFFDSTSSLQAIRIGEQVLLGVPADLSSQIGLKIKEYGKRLGLRVLIMGFANDYVGYIIPQESYKKGSYAGRMSFNGPHMDQYFWEIAIQVLDALDARALEPCHKDVRGGAEDPRGFLE